LPLVWCFAWLAASEVRGSGGADGAAEKREELEERDVLVSCTSDGL